MFRVEDREALLGLSQVKGVGIQTFKQVLANLEYESLSSLISKLNPRLRLTLTLGSLESHARSHLIQIRKHGIDCVVLGEEGYPELLAQIHDPPKVLYFRGNPEALIGSNSLSIVGTRKASKSGLFHANYLAEGLAKAGVVNVSGLAFGIDHEVHASTVLAAGKTVAVLPAGPGNITPRAHQKLSQQILDSGGAIVSEFPSSELVTPGMFPRRNRLIAGLSQATVVVEAGIKSGAMITARLAFNYGREVMAFPAPVGFESLAGTNLLIKQNIASLVEGVDDVKRIMGIIVKPSPRVLPHTYNDKLTDLIADKPYTIDEICDKLGLRTSEALIRLAKLELIGRIYKDENLCYRIAHV